MRCSVFGCNNSNQGASATTSILYHSFPKDATVRKQWLHLCGRKDKINPITARVCSIHFVEDDYPVDVILVSYGIENKRKKLKNGAVPTLHLPRHQPEGGSSVRLDRLTRRNENKGSTSSIENQRIEPSLWGNTDILQEEISSLNLTVKDAGRQKVKLAAKLFSHTIAEAINRATSLGELQSKNALECSDFFKLVNDWFDCLNVRVPHQDSRERTHGFGMHLPLQLEIIDKMTETMLNMRVNSKSAMMPFQKGIVMTNNALKLLFNDLKERYNIDYILTYRLNQDVLENFFGVIRSIGGLHDHPDQLQFLYRLRAYILGRNEGSISFEGNTGVDDTLDLGNAVNLSSQFFNAITDPILLEPEIDELASLNYDALEHLAGYICYRLKDSPELNLECNNLEQSYTWTNQLSEGGLRKPSDELMGQMELLEGIFNEINGKDALLFTKGFLQFHLENSLHIKCDDKVKNLFFRSRMYFRMRNLNKALFNSSRSKTQKTKKTVT